MVDAASLSLSLRPKIGNRKIPDFSLFTSQNLSIRALTKKSGISKSQLSDIMLGNKIPNIYTLHLICTALGISLSDFFDFEDTIIKLRGKEAILVKICRELSPMSQDTLIKVVKCMK